MTDQPDLQAALIPLAKAAGYRVIEQRGSVGVYRNRDFRMLLPGADGTLTDAEVTVVRMWLIKAGYNISLWPDEMTGKVFELTIETPFDEEERHGRDFIECADTENAALASAVLALHEASK